MSEKPEQIKKHIAALTEFEAKYGEYIGALEADWFASLSAGAIGAPDDLGSDLSADEFARLTREVQMLATRADRAIKASGVAPVGGSADLPSQAFDFEVNDCYAANDGMELQRKLLERIPSQISGLEIKLEEAEAAEEASAMRLLGEKIEESSARAQEQTDLIAQTARKATPQQPWERPVGKPKIPWHENPWVRGIGVSVIAGLILLLLGYMANQVF